jgi:hypothetical protein
MATEPRIEKFVADIGKNNASSAECRMRNAELEFVGL